MIPLAMVREGGEVKIYCVNCGKKLKTRLCDLGIYEGSEVKVIKNDITSPILLKIKDSKLILGRGQAHKILTEIVKERKNE